MTAEEYLEQYKDATLAIARAQTEYNKQMELVANIRSPQGSDGTPRSGEISKQVEDEAIQLEEKALDVKLAEVNALRVRQRIVRTIEKVGGIEAHVLTERFVNLRENGRMRTWYEVANSVGYSEDGVYAIRKRALEEVEKIINQRASQ